MQKKSKSFCSLCKKKYLTIKMFIYLYKKFRKSTIMNFFFSEIHCLLIELNTTLIATECLKSQFYQIKNFECKWPN